MNRRAATDTAASPDTRAGWTLTIKRTFEAPRELVFAAWTRREHLLHWLCPNDFTVLFVENDPRPGGAWRSGMRSPDGRDYIMGGVYREIREFDRLVFTQAWEQNDLEPAADTLITVELAEDAPGRTTMTFTHAGLATRESRDSHNSGWSGAFDNLAAHLANVETSASADGGAEIVITREFKAPRELVWRAWTEPEHVAKWLGPGEFNVRVDEQDLRPGGRWRYIMIGPDGTEYPSVGVYREVVAPERIVSTDDFGEGVEVPGVDLPRGMVVTCLFDETPTGARVTVRIDHPSPEERRKHEAMGVVTGWNMSLDGLEKLLASM